jgi:murein L,D-transpeptidase YafK
MTSYTRIFFILFLCCIAAHHPASAQDDSASFRNYQFSSSRVSAAWNKYDDTLRIAFAEKGLSWPAKDIFLRAFKSQNELELWARDNRALPYTRVKTFKICALSGTLGPKRTQGDKQVPEGFYFVDDFNPKSNYHLSLLLNYPNFADEIAASKKPGGNIYIHGGCVTVGCLPMKDEGIQEIYTACLNARINGQEHIPVHVYPTRMTTQGITYLMREYSGNRSKLQFWASLRKGYDYFEEHHKLLPVMYAPNGSYLN